MRYWFTSLSIVVTIIKSEKFARKTENSPFFLEMDRIYGLTVQILIFKNAKVNRIKVNAVCPRSSYPFYKVSDYIKWVTIFWTYSNRRKARTKGVFFFFNCFN